MAKWLFSKERIIAFFRPCIVLIIFIVASAYIPKLVPTLFHVKLIAILLQPCVMTVDIFAIRKLWDKRSINSLGLKRDEFWLSDILLGLCFIFLATIVVFLANWAFGWIKPESFFFILKLSPILALSEIEWSVLLRNILAGCWEELFFRGYVFKNKAWSTNILISAFLTSVLFGTFHFFFISPPSPMVVLMPADRFSAAFFALLSGLIFIFAYFRTRNLWLSIGLHVGWDLIVGPIMELGIHQKSLPEFMTNLFAAPNNTTGVNDIIILGLVAIFVYITTMPRNRHSFHWKAIISWKSISTQ